MKIYQTNTYVSKSIKNLVCDMCGKQSKYEDWAEDTYEVLETELRYKVGTSYPEGGNGEYIIVDLCPECFLNNLIPYLKTQGVSVETKEWDW